MFKIGRYIIIDLLKNRVIIGYFLLLIALGWGAFILEGQPEKSLLILMQITLIFLPMITMIFAAIYYYNSQEFIVLLLSHPIGRSAVFKSFYFGLSITFTLGYCLGLCLPLLIYYPTTESLFLMTGGVLLIFIFVSMAMYISVNNADKALGLGFTLLLWAFLAFLYDGILLFIMYQFSDYPIEKVILGLSLLNPIDIARILIIMKTEASAMLGLSGAVFQEFFGSVKGVLISISTLVVWVIIPVLLAWRVFLKKDM